MNNGFLPVFAWGLRRVVRWRKVLLVALVAIVGGIAIGRLVAGAAEPMLVLARVMDRGVLRIGLPLIALLLAGESFAYEVQSRTLVYHLVRPVSRATIFVARFFSGYIPAVIVASLFVASIYGATGIDLGTRTWASIPLVVGLGVLALSAIYFTLSALLKHGLIAGLVYTFARFHLPGPGHELI